MEKFNTEIDEIKEVEFNPLDEPVNEKKYTQANVNTAGIDMTKPIEEPKYTAPPFQKKTIPSQEKQTQEKKPPINPEMKNMPKKETEMAASQAAKMIIQGYEWMHDLANKGLVVSEKKLMRLQSEGEINLNAMIDYDNGVKMSTGDFIREYNKQVSSVLTVSQEFKDETIPVLERVLSKRGIGLTDEQYLMYLFGKDIAAKGLIFFQIKQQTNFMLENIKQASMMTQPSSVPTHSPQTQETDNMANDPIQKSKPTKVDEPYYTNIETDDEDDYIIQSKKKNSKEGEVKIIDKKPKGRPRK